MERETIKEPNYLIYIKSLIIGFLVSESLFLGYNLGLSFSLKALTVLRASVQSLFTLAESYNKPSFDDFFTVSGVVLAIVLLFTAIAINYFIQPYVSHREGHKTLLLILKRRRLDLILTFTFGIFISYFLLPQLEFIHLALRNAPGFIAPTVILFFFTVFRASLKQGIQDKKVTQSIFLSDEPIANESFDLFDTRQAVENFSQHVLNNNHSSGLVFGIDGPWGVGKSSLINMAQNYWLEHEKNIVVCRFEPLRYASESNITNRLITEITNAIQRKTFAPELKSAASRYSRLIKGKANFSLFGLKLSLSHTADSIDDLLEDIDDALKQLGLRVIIVIDDLDRLDPVSINNVLYATKQSFKLSQATYVLSFDTEILIGEQDNKEKAREFLEKFITVKLNVFTETKHLVDFLKHNWQKSSQFQLEGIPADTLVKLSSILEALALNLEGEFAVHYLPLLGSLRKLKRFINTILLMQIESNDLSQNDFNEHDFINLVLLHLNYPGLFRQIYLEETCNSKGSFSLIKKNAKYENSINFIDILNKQEGTAQFLLKQLFDLDTLGFNDANSFRLSDEVYFSRACFNSGTAKNLESFLKLIVRCIKPEPAETYYLYKNTVDKVINGEEYSELLNNPHFNTPESKDKLLTLLVSHSGRLNKASANNVIDTLIEQVQKSSILFDSKQDLRKRYILTLIRVLDRAGWGESAEDRRNNSNVNCKEKEIAWRILGTEQYDNNGILERFISSASGILGWQDLLLFRLYCCGDRGGQFYNLNAALIREQNDNEETTGSVNKLTIQAMRKISQEIFGLFFNRYISHKVNFFNEMEKTKEELFINSSFDEEEASYIGRLSNSERITVTKVNIANFVIYHLSNDKGPKGSGVGCGYYDEKGSEDNNGIANLMNDYLFDVCFNPEITEKNAIYFIDYCLSHLTSGFFSDLDSDDFVPTKEDIIQPLNKNKFREFWKRHKDKIKEVADRNTTRKVYTPNYIASYEEDLKAVLTTLGDILEEDQTTHIN
ncbi:KAP P-loop protein [Pseudoalteromonas shioyasakiensis]|nr:KAP P-loop protein [Pseudoalteromonas shioyasakiensis]